MFSASYCIAKPVEGTYRCAAKTYLSPDEVLYKKNSDIIAKPIMRERWRFYREDVTSKCYSGKMYTFCKYIYSQSARRSAANMFFIAIFLLYSSSFNTSSLATLYPVFLSIYWIFVNPFILINTDGETVIVIKTNNSFSLLKRYMLFRCSILLFP